MEVTDHPRPVKAVSITAQTVISAQSGATKATLMLFNSAVIRHPPKKHLQMGVGICAGRAVAIPAGWQVKGLLEASGLSAHSFLCAIKHRYTEAHQSISALCSSVEIFTLFQICGLKVLGKYKLLRSKARQLFRSTKCSICFWFMKTRHKAEWAALIFWDLRSTAGSFSQWPGCLRGTRIVPEQRPPCPESQKTLFRLLLFVSDLRYKDTRHNSRDLSRSLTALPHSGFRHLPGHRAAAEEQETRGWP